MIQDPEKRMQVSLSENPRIRLKLGTPEFESIDYISGLIEWES